MTNNPASQNRRRPRARKSIGIGAALILVAAVLAALATRDSGSSSTLDSAGSGKPTTTLPAEHGQVAGDDGSSEVPDAADSSGESPTTVPSSTVVPESAPAVAPPPITERPDPDPKNAGQNAGLGAEPGRYVYDQEGSYSGAFGSGELPPEAVVQVLPSTKDGRQLYRSEGDQGSGDLDTLHHADRIEVVSLSGFQGPIALDPPAEVIRLAATAGTKWDWERSTDFGPVQGKFAVVAVENQLVAGEPVEVRVIDYRIDGQADFQGNTYTYVVEGTWRVSSAHRMIVADTTTLTVHQQPVAGPAVGPALIESTSSRTLRSLTPA